MIKTITFTLIAFAAIIGVVLFFAHSLKTKQKIINNPTLTPTSTLSLTPTDFQSPTISQNQDCCTPEQIRQGYQCILNCSGPVIHGETSSSSYSCLSPEEAEKRSRVGCPICLSANTRIATPNGEVNITDLQTGIYVWTLNSHRHKIATKILETSRTPSPDKHQMVNLRLLDGRTLQVSPGHPTTNGKLVKNLQIGDFYDNSIIVAASLLPYDKLYTYDLLPAGDTGFYWANGILLRSSLK